MPQGSPDHFRTKLNDLYEQVNIKRSAKVAFQGNVLIKKLLYSSRFRKHAHGYKHGSLGSKVVILYNVPIYDRPSKTPSSGPTCEIQRARDLRWPHEPPSINYSTRWPAKQIREGIWRLQHGLTCTVEPFFPWRVLVIHTNRSTSLGNPLDLTAAESNPYLSKKMNL